MTQSSSHPKKRLIVCCDGTWQDLDCAYPTNVVKLAQAIKNSDSQGKPQILYYSEGIGSGASKFERCMAGAFGWGIDQKIQSAYRFLCSNYEPGDEIYLFGFSRGAYTVRSLAGMIYKCGLLKRHLIRETKEVYAIYRDRSKSPSDSYVVNFRRKNAVEGSTENSKADYQVPITLLACWDTVGSLGIPQTFPWSGWVNKKYKFHDHRVNPKVRLALHAMAIDECRSSFDVTHMEPHEQWKPENGEHQKSQVTEVWFAGDHGCVGGGMANHGLSDIPLDWMIRTIQEQKLGLEFVEETKLDSVIEGKLQMDPYASFDNRRKGIFAFLPTKNREFLPEKLPAGTSKGQFYTDLFEHQIHESVKERCQRLSFTPLYRPAPLDKLKKWLNEHPLSEAGLTSGDTLPGSQPQSAKNGKNLPNFRQIDIRILEWVKNQLKTKPLDAANRDTICRNSAASGQ